MQKIRSKHWISWTLIVLSTVLATIALLANWANRQALNTDAWVKTSSALLQSPEVQSATASYLAQELIANPATSKRVGGVLPKELKGLAGPITGLLADTGERIALQAIQSGQFQKVWEQANRVAHTQLLAVIEGKNVKVNGNQVELDLRPMLKNLATRVGVNPNAVNKIPPSIGVVHILKADQIKTVQKGGNLLRGLMWWTLILTVLSIAGAISFASSRRKATMRIGIGLALAGVLALIIRHIAGNDIVGTLTSSGAGQPAAQATWDIATSLLVEAAWALIVFGLVLIAGSWLYGSNKWASKFRHFVKPAMKHPAVPIVTSLTVILLLVTFGLLPWAARPIAILIYLLGGLGFALAFRKRTLAEQTPAAS